MKKLFFGLVMASNLFFSQDLKVMTSTLDCLWKATKKTLGTTEKMMLWR
ncbi:hypothetical protein [Epilithonimonas hominis]|uniref:Uncharacterized protein n=1 Tax=Epilithonimonas hominis TaxID=420404 RepID=A0A1H6LZB9_9FLAO|nr:hypothetical protein [Epilithonimonas hominis]SEH94238.1 hypothetical protein SAMN05421793_1582 [Epilithonimonas hominis]